MNIFIGLYSIIAFVVAMPIMTCASVEFGIKTVIFIVFVLFCCFMLAITFNKKSLMIIFGIATIMSLWGVGFAYFILPRLA